LTHWKRYILVMKASSYSVWVRWSSVGGTRWVGG